MYRIHTKYLLIWHMYVRFRSNLEKQKSDEMPPKSPSLLGELPPLAPPAKNPAMTLAPLKKIPPVAKVEATKKEEVKTAKPALEVRPMSKAIEAESNTPSVSVDEDIDEEIDEFLNSSISASEDFTKDESVTEDASLRADYVEKL